MPLVPVHIERFTGLDLRSDPAEVGLTGAIDLLNVDFDREGRIRQRDGYDNFTDSAAAARYDTVYPGVAGGVVASRGDDIDGIASDGSVTATRDMGESGASAIRFGTPSATTVYVANTGSACKWNGAAWSALASLPKATVIGVQPSDNRLVMANTSSAGGPGGATSSVHHVWFSDAGDPETFGANNYVILNPGDGEAITAMAAFQSQLFVFKYSRIFVFYGNSTDGTGQPVFNYRVVDNGVGCSFDECAVTGDDAVYFVNRRGIYRTAGGPPELISRPLDPFFLGTVSAFWQSGAFANTGQPAITWSEGRLYVAFSSGVSSTNNVTFVWDRATGNWTAWDTPMGAMASIPGLNTDRNSLIFAYASGSNHLGVLGSAYTTDDGTSITSRYRSGFGDLGYPGQEKVIREAEITGQGTVQFGWSRDFGSITTTSQDNVTMGTAPATDRGYHRKSQDGELLGWQASSVSGGAWQINRLTAFLRDVRPPAENTG